MNTAAARAAGAQSSVTRKAVTTVLTGGLTFLITNALNQPQATSITLSILIGGIALMVRFLVDFERRLAAVERIEKEGQAATKQLVRDTFGEISEATELYRLIGASVLEDDMIRRLVRNAVQIPQTAPPIVHHFVGAKIRETADQLKQIAEGGTVTYYGEDREWLLGLTTHATAGIDAISLAAVDHNLWQSEIGQHYLDAQHRVAAAGKRVRRIFVLDKDGIADKELLRVCEEQHRMGIEVKLLVQDDVPTPLRVQVRDLIVFDDSLAYETTPTTADPRVAQIAETRLVLTPSRVERCVQLFRQLWDVSREPASLASPSGSSSAPGLSAAPASSEASGLSVAPPIGPSVAPSLGPSVAPSLGPSVAPGSSATPASSAEAPGSSSATGSSSASGQTKT